MGTPRSRAIGTGTVIVAAVAMVVAGFILISSAFRGSSAGAAAALPDHVYAASSVADPFPSTRALPEVLSSGPAVTATSATSRPESTAAGTAPVALLPDRLVIPVLGVNAPVVRTPLVNGSLELPEEVNTVTRWTGGADPAGKQGTTLVAGHVDNKYQGEGALFWIHTLQAGDVIYLTTDKKATRWKVTGMESFVKRSLPASVFAGSSGPRRLVLVTCGGPFANGNYEDNVVVTAQRF
ncbi:Sortase family protein [Nakamurella panacisegetis]|uniref:Sortase family protein n=1 Tax=Nakamurella panacisegetis TaxID=1090615 RepID=A0A1H0LLD3_9ACTN|nr:class F sortase [Nakamurella panacisegetis]SDO68700.1 Sortase family protein [Nakamurella panacisegetis]